MNVQIISLEATFKTVLVCGTTDMFWESVLDGSSGNWERSVAKLGRCPLHSVIRVIRRRSRRCDEP